MIKEYIIKVTKEGYYRVSASNFQDACEIVEEGGGQCDDETIVDMDYVDEYDEDVDAIYDDYKLGLYADEEEDMEEYDEDRFY